MSRKGRKKGYSAGTICIGLIVLAFLAIMSVQIYKLKQKDEMYAQREQNLLEQLAEESQRAEELEDGEEVKYELALTNYEVKLMFENRVRSPYDFDMFST